MSERLLIISNNSLSNEKNNGKTLYSFFDCLPNNRVRQLYFSSEEPGVAGYNYFRISDKDIIKGLLKKANRGKALKGKHKVFVFTKKRSIENKLRKTPLERLAREALWHNKWKSDQLDRWLDEFSPTAIFFLGGDSIFAYDICTYVKERYNSRVAFYLTDDYIVPHRNESVSEGVRRKLIHEKIQQMVNTCDRFYTVSEQMRTAYRKILGKDSDVIFNMCEPMKVDYNTRENRDYLTLTYAGSLYYGREDVLHLLASKMSELNKTKEKKCVLNIFTNTALKEQTREKIELEGTSFYRGSLTKKN